MHIRGWDGEGGGVGGGGRWCGGEGGGGVCGGVGGVRVVGQTRTDRHKNSRGILGYVINTHMVIGDKPLLKRKV